MHSRKISKIIALLVALLMIGGLLYLYNGLCGNPITKIKIKNCALEYINEKYSDKDYEIESIGYNFKDGTYAVQVISPSSADSNFMISFKANGEISYDYYESNVLSKNNVANRINDEYRMMVDSFLENDFSYKSDIAFGEIKIYENEAQALKIGYPECDEHAIYLEDLELDKEYNVKSLAKKAGNLVIYIDSEDTSFKNASEIILDIKRQFDEKDIPFATLNFVLRNKNSDYQVNFNLFKYEDIYEEDLEIRIKEAHDKLCQYYQTQDKSK